MKYTVDGTTRDMGNVEKEFDGENALLNACLKAQNIEEDGGSATVTDEDGNVIDHWKGYRIGLDPASGTDSSVGLVFEAGLITDLKSYDGVALPASAFGEFNEQGQWTPKEPEGVMPWEPPTQENQDGQGQDS